MTKIKTTAQSEEQSDQISKTALVVDDSKLARYVLKEMLVKHGIAVTTASSAEEALGLLCTLKPDVIFMDHMMPGMDGFEALHAIKNDPKTATIPIMMYTSREQTCDKDVYFSQARALGAVGVLPKKLKPMELENVLRQLKLLSDDGSDTEATRLDNASVQVQLGSKDASESLRVDSNVSPMDAVEVQPNKVDVSPQPVIEELDYSSSQIAASSAQDDIQFDQDAIRIINESRHSLEELAKSAEEEYEKDSMRMLFRQLFNEQKEGISSSQREAIKSLVAQTSPWFFSSHKRFLRWQQLTFVTVVAVILWISSVFYNENQQEMQAVLTLQQQLNEQQLLIQKLSDQLNDFQQQSSLQGVTPSEDTASYHEANTREALVAVESTSFELASLVGSEISQNSDLSTDESEPQALGSTYQKDFSPLRLPYGVSFDDERLQANLISVLRQLDQDQYQGTLKVTLHTGRFCEEQGFDGLMTQAVDELPLSDCLISVLSAMEYANRVSLDFETFMKSIRNKFPNQRVELEDAGRHSVLISYPKDNGSVSAGEWNRVALANNRLEFALLAP